MKTNVMFKQMQFAVMRACPCVLRMLGYKFGLMIWQT